MGEMPRLCKSVYACSGFAYRQESGAPIILHPRISIAVLSLGLQFYL